MPKKETLVRTRVVVTQDEGGCHTAMSGEWIQHGGPDGGGESWMPAKGLLLTPVPGKKSCFVWFRDLLENSA